MTSKVLLVWLERLTCIGNNLHVSSYQTLSETVNRPYLFLAFITLFFKKKRTLNDCYSTLFRTALIFVYGICTNSDAKQFSKSKQKQHKKIKFWKIITFNKKNSRKIHLNFRFQMYSYSNDLAVFWLLFKSASIFSPHRLIWTFIT